MRRGILRKWANLSLGFFLLCASFAVIANRIYLAYRTGNPEANELKELDLARLQLFVVFGGVGAGILGYTFWDFEVPLWEVRAGKKTRQSRDAATVAIGSFVITIGLGYAVLSYFGTTLLGKSAGLIVVWEAIAAIGTALLVYGIHSSTSPALFGSDDAHHHRSSYMLVGTVFSFSGIALISFLSWYGSVKYIEYVEADREFLLGEVVLVGILTGIILVLAGIISLFKAVPFITYRARLHPAKESQEGKPLPSLLRMGNVSDDVYNQLNCRIPIERVREGDQRFWTHRWPHSTERIPRAPDLCVCENRLLLRDCFHFRDRAISAQLSKPR